MGIKMNTYRITLKKKDYITQVPDSQRLFGALIYLFSDCIGREQCSELVQEIKNKQIGFWLSSLMPKGCYPIPLEYIIKGRKDNKETDNKERYNKEDYKALKRCPYGTKEAINQLLRGEIKKGEIKEFIQKKIESKEIYRCDRIYQQRLHLADEYAIECLKNIPYSIQKIQLKPETEEFYFFLAIEGEQEKIKTIETALHQAVDNKELLVLGPRASQGLNLFQLNAMEGVDLNYEKKIEKVYLNMGMLLPDKIEYETSSLRLFTSERRPYHMDGKYKKDKVKENYISFIDSGSVVKTKEDRKAASKSISSINEGDIIFGNSFLYPLKQEGEVNVIV